MELHNKYKIEVTEHYIEEQMWRKSFNISKDEHIKDVSLTHTDGTIVITTERRVT